MVGLLIRSELAQGAHGDDDGDVYGGGDKDASCH